MWHVIQNFKKHYITQLFALKIHYIIIYDFYLFILDQVRILSGQLLLYSFT
jgi:hypothetical protein